MAITTASHFDMYCVELDFFCTGINRKKIAGGHQGKPFERYIFLSTVDGMNTNQ
jgi:hypothetical protein